MSDPQAAQPDYSHLAGHSLPGGSYTLPSYVSWLWTDAVTGKPDERFAHPEIAYMVGLHGGGASIGDIMALLGAAQDSGVLFGEIEFEFAKPLTPETSYHVAGWVASVERKHGRKAGVFDRAVFVHELTAEGEQTPSARVTHTWIFPRREAS